MKTKILLFTNIFISLLTVLSYAAPNVSPEDFWPAGFVAFFIPVGIGLNILLLLIWLVVKPVGAILPLATLALGYSYIARAYAMNFYTKSTATTNYSLSVLSYNVRVFNCYKHLRSDAGYSSSKDMMDFIAHSGADVVCLQEFYNDEDSDVFNTVDKISAKYPYFYATGDLKNVYGDQFGLAIFSKFKIVDTGYINFSKQTKNRVLYADVEANRKKIRIYNLHLQSMHIEEQKIVDAEWGINLKENILGELKKVKKGMVDRAAQLRTIEDNMENCRHNIIVCGDLNDVPFSYTYQQLKNKFRNAHEEAGLGWGTTYNGKLPLLRIDDQFADPEFSITYSRTFHSTAYSDHFPNIASYSW